jgi:hypothetical protein
MFVSEIPVTELDPAVASMRRNLHIITADDPNPQERDDGYAVAPLRTRPDLLRVSVCIADPSADYYRSDVYKQALEKTTAGYWINEDGSHGYDPMINEDVIRNHEFTKGTSPSALVASFTIGPEKPPSELEIYFSPVQVVSNMTFSNLARTTAQRRKMERYKQASALIRGHLGYNSGVDWHHAKAAGVVVSAQTAQVRPEAGISKGSLRGSKINEAFMIAFNHLVALEMERLDEPYIYRVHNPEDERYRDVLPPEGRALYSMSPGRHQALGLSRYSHSSSPLRRGVDLVNGHILKKLSRGESISGRDMRDMEMMVRRSNLRILQEEAGRPFRLRSPRPIGARALPAVIEVA